MCIWSFSLKSNNKNHFPGYSVGVFHSCVCWVAKFVRISVFVTSICCNCDDVHYYYSRNVNYVLQVSFVLLKLRCRYLKRLLYSCIFYRYLVTKAETISEVSFLCVLYTSCCICIWNLYIGFVLDIPKPNSLNPD